MEGRVAILGWGSLIWDLESLAPEVEGPWAMRAGPALPLEFSRISPKRKMGLVVCIDPALGVPCPTHAIASRRDDPRASRADLARRERAPLELIGWVCARSGRGEGRSAEAALAWCAATGAAGAVWTDLRPNWAEHHPATPFSLEAAEAYLMGLAGASRDEAVRYIASAPAETDTPLRRRLAARDWWRAEVERVLAPGRGGRSVAGDDGAPTRPDDRDASAESVSRPEAPPASP